MVQAKDAAAQNADGEHIDMSDERKREGHNVQRGSAIYALMSPFRECFTVVGSTFVSAGTTMDAELYIVSNLY